MRVNYTISAKAFASLSLAAVFHFVDHESVFPGIEEEDEVSDSPTFYMKVRPLTDSISGSIGTIGMCVNVTSGFIVALTERQCQALVVQKDAELVLR